MRNLTRSRKKTAFASKWVFAMAGSVSFPATVRGEIWFARENNQGCWLISITHSGVAAELGLAPASVQCPGIAAYAFLTLEPLYRALNRVYKLAASLPDIPLVDGVWSEPFSRLNCPVILLIERQLVDPMEASTV